MGECKDKALDLLSRRPHFRAELGQKLRDRGFPEDAVEATLADLDRLGLLNDLENARSLASGSMTRKGFGPRRMRFELVRRGVDESMAEQAVSEVFAEPESELARAMEVAAGAGLGTTADRQRLARKLDRRGFSKSVILSIMEQLDSR